MSTGTVGGVMLVPIEAQIRSAERELRYRIRVYPRWIEAGKITQETANNELAAMRAVVDTLQRVARRETLL